MNNGWIILADLAAIPVTSRWVIRLEERKLAEAFGDCYREYFNHVRRWI